MTWFLFPIGMFPWIMIVCSMIFFPPDWPRRALSALLRRPVPPTPAIRTRVLRPTWTWYVMAAGLAVYSLVQIAVPMRHLIYPGDVRWNEEGYRFAWRMMLTEKTGHARFRVTDPSTGEEWLEYPEKYFTPLQVERMAYQPDMILSAAHRIANDMHGSGGRVPVASFAP